MRLILNIAIFLCLAVPVIGQVTVEVDTWPVERDPSGVVLGIPRQQVLAAESGQVVVFISGWQGRNLFLGRPLGEQMLWQDTLSLTRNPLISNADYHSHLSIDHDTIYAAVPPPGGDSMLVKVIGIQDGSLFDVDYSFTRGYRAPGGWNNYTVYRGGVWFVPGSDTAILVTRGHDGDGNDAMDIVSFVSPDRGRTWSDSIRVTDLTDATDQTRIGGINFFNGTVSALVYSREMSGVLWFNWDRSSRSWSGESAMPLVGTFDRGYTGNVIGGTQQFVACCNAGTHSRDTVFYAWKSLGQSKWNQGSLPLSQYSGIEWIHTNLVYIEKSQRLVLFYQQYDGNTTDSLHIYCRDWQPSKQTWSSATRVSTGSAAMHMSPSLRTPESHGDVAYISYYQDDPITGNEQVELARVRFNETIEPCECVGNTGNLDCSADQEVTMGDLTALIDHLFITLSPLCCDTEGYLDEDPEVTVSDLTVLIDHLFITLAPLPACR